MEFKSAYLNDTDNVEDSRLIYSYFQAEQDLKNLLKNKYGKIIEKPDDVIIFQLEEQGNKVLRLIHKETNNEVYVLLPYNEDTFRKTKREIKNLGFAIKRI